MPSNYTADRQPGVLRSLDWWTIGIYIALLTFGWVSVCGASYTYGDTEIFSLSTRSGMQIVWIGTSICLGFVLLMMDDRFYDTFAYVIYGLLVLLLFATIFNPHSIKGSRSWLVMGPLRLQPAEFAKFATALAIAKFMSLMALLSRIGSILLVRAELFSYQCCVLSDSVRRVLPWFISPSSSCFIVKECLERSFSQV